jgi:Ca2+/H+ antiporter
MAMLIGRVTAADLILIDAIHGKLAVEINWLLIFVSITVALEHAWPQAQTWIFFAACVAIIPIAHLIVEATEHIALRTGDVVGGTSPGTSCSVRWRPG